MTDLILALDTCGGTHVSIVRDGAQVASAHRDDPRGHAEHTAPLVAQALATAGLERTDLTAIAVGTGPAPFTGLRVGLVTAQMLGAALGVPVWGVPSHDAWAASAFAAHPDLAEVLVATDARRKEVHTARYRREESEPGGLVRLGELTVSRPEPSGPAVGTAAALYPQDYTDLGVTFDAAQLARLGLARVRVGHEVPLTPLYLRRPDVHGVPGALEGAR